MKHWQFYFAIIIFILFLFTLKEGLDIPANASARSTPLDLMNTMQGVMAGNKTYDMIENKNLLYEKEQTVSYRDDAKDLLTRDTGTLEKCNTDLIDINFQLTDMQAKVKACNASRDEENRLYSDCIFNVKPTVEQKYWNTYGTLVGVEDILKQCQNITKVESNAVDKCIADTKYYNSN